MSRAATRAAVVMVVGGFALLAAGCATYRGTSSAPGSSVEFIAANSSTVLVDFARGNDAEMDVAKQVAVDKCTLFGGNRAVLESLNLRSDGRERAIFLCQ